jgi:hypothetical protein
VFTLAKEGGFTEAQILEMPIYRVNAYYHAALRSHDIWTTTESVPAEEQIADLLEFASAQESFDRDEDY